jgi:hypothetical protein
MGSKTIYWCDRCGAKSDKPMPFRVCLYSLDFMGHPSYLDYAENTLLKSLDICNTCEEQVVMWCNRQMFMQPVYDCKRTLDERMGNDGADSQYPVHT